VGSMTALVPQNSPNEPGLFVNPNWTPGTPGTFAVIIGVSEYTYLEGGSNFRTGDEAFGLGQLFVSAATAHAVFDWLQDRYDYPAAPPAQCWLLLSPTTEELIYLGAPAPPGGSPASVETIGAAPAILANCETAIGSWNDAMSQLSTTDAANSRGLFFFCGHGLEIAQDAQVLLPSDYLRRPGRSVNDALSTANLLKGLPFSPVPNHFLFLDACRNDVPRLREYVLEGRSILNQRQAALANRDSLTGALYASATGSQTWQPRTIESGISLFGQALIEGLQGVPGMQRDGCNGTSCEIRFDPLKAFVESRMSDMLSEFGSPEKARVRQGGNPPRAGITLVSDASPPGTEGPAPTSPPDQALESRYDVVHANMSLLPGQDYLTTHNALGSERMTDIWASSARAYDLATGAELPREDMVIREVRRSSDTKAFRIAIDLPWAEAGVWLRFTDPRGHHFAASLASSNQYERPVYEFTIDFELDDQEMQPIASSSRSVSTFEARLSPLSENQLGAIATIWSTYERQNVTVALQQADADGLMGMVMDKLVSPLTATAAAVLLFRAHQLDRLDPTWLDNLAQWFPHNADGSVLRGERERLTPQSAEQEAVVLDQLGDLYQR
jgi:hypothetical protein